MSNEIKVNDRVRLLRGLYDGQTPGDEGTVVKVYQHGDIDVLVDGEDKTEYYFVDSEFEKIESTKVIRDNPLPYEVWVGDRLVAAFRWEGLRNALIGQIRGNIPLNTKENFDG